MNTPTEKNNTKGDDIRPDDIRSESPVARGSRGEQEPRTGAAGLSGGSEAVNNKEMITAGKRSGMSPYYGMHAHGGYGYGGYGGYNGYYGGNYGGGGGNVSFGGFSLGRMLRRKWLMLAVFILASGAAVPWIWILNRPEYQANATVRVSPVVSRLVFATENNGYLPLYSSYINTQVATIRSSKILERVLDRAKIRETVWYREEGRSLLEGKSSPLTRLKNATSVMFRRDTELIDVTVTTYNADDAKVLVDAVVDEYKTHVDETLRENEGWVVETLQRERASLQKDIEGLIGTRFNLAKRVGSPDVTASQKQLNSYLSILENEQRQQQRSLDMVRWQLEQMNSVTTQPQGQGDETNAEAPVSADLERYYPNDPQWREISQGVRKLEDQLEIALQDYGEEHPVIKRLQKAMEQQKRLLAEREKELDQEWSELPGGGVGSRVTMDRRVSLEQAAHRIEQEIQLISEEIDRQRAHLSDVTDIAMEIATLEDQIANKRALAELVRQRLQSLEFEGKAPMARVRIASYGVKPSAPSSDRRVTMTMMTLLVSLMMSLVAGYLRSTVDKRIYDAGEVQQVYRAPFLGLVPELSSIRVPRELGGALPLAATKSSYYGSYLGRDSCQALMESVRMVRTSLLERVSEKDQRVVLFTSAVPRTGKTSVAVLMARSLAMLNKRVLLVEADLRHPTLAGRLNVEAKQGLAAVLTGAARDEQAVVRTEINNLDVIVAGEIPDEFNTECLANGVFASCIERWREEYDFVLMDSPPILPVADSRILAGYADGTIMVLRSSHDLRHEAMEAYAQLSAAGGKLVGTMLIGGSMGRTRPYGYGYLQFPVTWRWRQRYGYLGQDSPYGYGYSSGGSRSESGQRRGESPDTGPKV